jgi:cellulose synthase/poly-beta-1,6-N-acetylglucosamine synthase-like glycosyltransferase
VSRVFIFTALALALCVWSFYSPKTFLISLAYFTTIAYSIWGGYHLLLSFVGLRPPLNPDLNLSYYPKISMIVPARNEPLLSRTIEACLFHTAYPDDRKEIVVVTDDPSGERIGCWYQQKYPGAVKVLARRQFYPTKPSALNDALALCTGDIVAVMDVEDIPDRDIFLKAASAVTLQGYSAVQAILRISNADDSWISKIFSMEYAGWFRLWLNARYQLGVYAPLGGTGNYFRRSVLGVVGAWDPTNLAEDAEVGIRLGIAGWRVAVIDGRHWEEAPVTFQTWLRQRTRWFRGWMQSLWKYSSFLVTPTAFRRLGFRPLVTVVLMLMAPFIMLLNWLAYGLTAYWLLESTGLVTTNWLSGAFPVWAFVPLAFNVLYYFVWIEGSAIENIGSKRELVKYVPHMFYYCNVMMPLAALRALYQEVFTTVQWEKTTHPGRGVKWVTPENIATSI